MRTGGLRSCISPRSNCAFYFCACSCANEIRKFFARKILSNNVSIVYLWSFVCSIFSVNFWRLTFECEKSNQASGGRSRTFQFTPNATEVTRCSVQRDEKVTQTAILAWLRRETPLVYLSSLWNVWRVIVISIYTVAVVESPWFRQLCFATVTPASFYDGGSSSPPLDAPLCTSSAAFLKNNFPCTGALSIVYHLPTFSFSPVNSSLHTASRWEGFHLHPSLHAGACSCVRDLWSTVSKIVNCRLNTYL